VPACLCGSKIASRLCALAVQSKLFSRSENFLCVLILSEVNFFDAGEAISVFLPVILPILCGSKMLCGKFL
jgi:hypothetical protein